MAVEARLLDDAVRDDSARARRPETRPLLGRSREHRWDLDLAWAVPPSPAAHNPNLGLLAMGARGPWSVSALTMRFELSCKPPAPFGLRAVSKKTIGDDLSFRRRTAGRVRRAEQRGAKLGAVGWGECRAGYPEYLTVLA